MMAQPRQQSWRWVNGHDRWWDGLTKSRCGLWYNQQWRGNEWQGRGWGRAPWYPSEPVLDANGNRVEPNTQVEGYWAATLEAIDTVTATYQNVPNTQVEGYNLKRMQEMFLNGTLLPEL